jgi:hypothetical protein
MCGKYACQIAKGNRQGRSQERENNEELNLLIMRKTILISLMAIFTIATGLSQTKGDKSIGAGFGVAITAIPNESFSVGVALAPQFDYFFADNCDLGLSIGYQFQTPESHIVLFQPSFNYYVKMVEGLYYVPGISLAGGYVNVGYGSGAFGIGFELFKLEFRPTQKLGIAFNAFAITYVGIVSAYSNILSSIGFNINSNSSLVFKYYF